MVVVSCTSNSDGTSSTLEDNDVFIALDDIKPPTPTSDTESDVDSAVDVKEDTYSMYTDPCVECKWYYCPPLDSVWQKQICTNICEDPHTIVYETECIEYMECDPT